MSRLFGTSYTFDQGVQRRWKTGVRAYTLASVLALIIVVGAAFFLSTLVDKATSTPNQTATSSSHVDQQSGSPANAGSRSAASNSQQGGTAPTGTQTGKTATATSGTSSGSSPSYSSGSTTTGSLPVGGYGGGGTASPSTTSTTSSTSTLLSDPAALVPYSSTTPVAPLTVVSGDKQVLGATGPTIVTN